MQDDNIGFIVMWVVLDKTDCNGEKSNSLSLTFVRQPTALVANKLLPALAKNMLTAYFLTRRALRREPKKASLLREVARRSRDGRS